MVRQSGSSSGAQFAQAFPLELDAMGGVDNAVKDRFGQSGIPEHFDLPLISNGSSQALR
jgi:hypothetical protein